MNIERANPSDCNTLLDFFHDVFRRDRPDHPRFEDFYPDLFDTTEEKMFPHAIIREENSKKILSCVGAYPMNLHIEGCTIPFIGIGQVSTSAEALGKGYMSALLKHQLEYYKNQGYVLAWLSGRHDRYANFGFESVSLSFLYEFDKHSVNKQKSNSTVVRVPFEDIEKIFDDSFMEIREEEDLFIEDTRENLLKRLKRCNADLWVVYKDNKPSSWAFVSDKWSRIIEIHGDIYEKLDIIIEATSHYGRLSLSIPHTQKSFNNLLRKLCVNVQPKSEMLAILDKEKFINAYRPCIRPGTRIPSKELIDGEFERTCFGPESNSLFLPFNIPPHYHV